MNLRGEFPQVWHEASQTRHPKRGDYSEVPTPGKQQARGEAFSEHPSFAHRQSLRKELGCPEALSRSIISQGGLTGHRRGHDTPTHCHNDQTCHLSAKDPATFPKIICCPLHASSPLPLVRGHLSLTSQPPGAVPHFFRHLPWLHEVSVLIKFLFFSG